MAIEWTQTQLTLPNLDGLVAAQKAAAAASQQAAAAMRAEAASAEALTVNVTELSDAEMAFTESVTAQAQASIAAADASDRQGESILRMIASEREVAIATATAAETTNAFAGSQAGLYRGLSSSLRGMVLMGVATGELDAKSLQAIVAVEGLAGAMRGATRIAAAFEIAVAPVFLGMVALVAVLYEAEQAWTAEARAQKEAAEQSKKNFDEEKEAATLTMEVVRRWGQVQREANEDATRAVGQYIEALEKQHQKEQELLNSASREFNLKPGERMRLNRDRGVLGAGGVLSDRELAFAESHTSGAEQHSLQRMEQERIRARGGNPQFSDGKDETYQRSLEHATTAKTSLENTGRSIEQRLQAILNAIDARLKEGEYQLKQQKHAAVAGAAATSNSLLWQNPGALP
jgi:hypothetical protein